MPCPVELAAILGRILQVGILRTRAAGWSSDARVCAIEADHIHNLPALLIEFSPDGLRYYCEVERPAFIREMGAEQVQRFAPIWKELDAWFSHEVASVNAG